MPTPAERLIRVLTARGQVLAPERAALDTMFKPAVAVGAGEDLVVQGGKPGSSTLLLSGLAWRYKILPDGGRQVVAIHVAGDFVDLHSFLLVEMDHSVGALSQCEVARLDHRHLFEITERYPNLSRLLWQLTLVDAAQHREWLAGMGRRDALGRLGHLLCELYVRLRLAGLAQDHVMDFSATREQLADTLGISSVHVSRIMRELQERGLVAATYRQIRLLDWHGLTEVSQFDPGYLQLSEAVRANLI